MKILFLTQRVPFPPNRGDKIRAFHIIKGLSRKHRIWLCSTADLKEDLSYKTELSSLCESVDLFPFNPKFRKVFSFICFLTGSSMSEFYFYSKRMKKRVGELINEVKFDLIYVFSSAMAQYIPDNFRGKILMDFIDADSDKWKQYANITGMPMNKIYLREARLIQSLEKQLLDRAEVSLVVSENDREILQKMNAAAKIEVIRNGTDTDFFKPNMEKKEKSSIVFTGMMDYLPNIDGVIHFMEDVWPRIKKIRPDARFYIVGGNPTPEIKKYDGKDSVIVTGYVSDTREYLQKAAVAVVPLRIARGIQNKILEALASGTPVVTSKVAAEGLDLNKENGLLIANDPEIFADNVVKILNNDKLHRDLSQKAVESMRKHFSWDDAIHKIENILTTDK